MGGNNSRLSGVHQASGEETAFDERQLEFKQEVQCEVYGRCKVYCSGQVPFLIAHVQRLLPNSSSEDIAEMTKHYKQNQELQHESLVRLLHFGVDKKEHFCSTILTVNCYYEFAGGNLQKDIKRRRREQGPAYEEGELWHIAASVIAALAYLQSRGITHGDIHPSSILLNEEGSVKIFPSQIFMKGVQVMSNIYTQSLAGMRQPTYLSPILLASLRKQEQNPVHNIPKSDAFSLGLTLLEAALLEEVQENEGEEGEDQYSDLLDYDNLSIISSVLVAKIEKVKVKYGPSLHSYLRELLIEEEVYRYSIEELYNLLEQARHRGTLMADRITPLPPVDSAATNHQNTNNFSVEQDSLNLDHLMTEQDEVVKRMGKNSSTKNLLIESAFKQQPSSINQQQWQHELQQQLEKQESQRQSDQVTTKSQPQIQLPCLREERVRRSDWTLLENNDNTIYTVLPTTTTTTTLPGEQIYYTAGSRGYTGQSPTNIPQISHIQLNSAAPYPFSNSSTTGALDGWNSPSFAPSTNFTKQHQQFISEEPSNIDVINDLIKKHSKPHLLSREYSTRV